MKRRSRLHTLVVVTLIGAFAFALIGPGSAQEPDDYVTQTPTPTPAATATPAPTPTATPPAAVLGLQVNRPPAQVAGLPVTGADVIQLGALAMWVLALGGMMTRIGRRQRS